MQRISLNPKVESVPTSYRGNAASDALRVFWAPGCSSCIKVKEHLKRLGIEFESVNVVTQPEASKELSERGIRGVPVVSRGDRYVYAQSLEVVNEFLGVSEELPTRQTAFIFEKWIALLKIAVGYLEICPSEELQADVLKERERPVGELSYHAFQIVQAFLHCMHTGDRDWFERSSGPVNMDVALNKPLLLAFARDNTEKLERYWNQGATEFVDVVGPFEGGLKSTHEFLDRSSWHSAQHVRQVAAVLGRDGIELLPPWSDDMVQGLGVPKGLWQ
jgi:glutaredoxin